MPQLRQLRLQVWKSTTLTPALENQRLERLQLDAVPRLTSLAGFSPVLRELDVANGGAGPFPVQVPTA
jgi:hypothetical protein